VSPAALACHVALVCAGRRHLSGDPASTVDPRRRRPSPLVSRSRVREHRAMRLHAFPRHRAPTHRRRWLSLRFYALAQLAWSTLRGRRAFWPGRFAVLVAPLLRTRPSPPRVMRRRFLGQPAFRYPRFGLRGLVGPLFGGRSLLGFPSRELGRQRGRPVVTRVTVSLSTPFARRRSWGFQMSLRRFDPTDGRASRFHALGPTCRSSLDRSRCFSRAIGRPG
jgi:hypothetical protein